MVWKMVVEWNFLHEEHRKRKMEREIISYYLKHLKQSVTCIFSTLYKMKSRKGKHCWKSRNIKQDEGN